MTVGANDANQGGALGFERAMYEFACTRLLAAAKGGQPGQAGSSQQTAAPTSKAIDDEAKRLFRAAFDDLQAKNYDQAISNFKAGLMLHPADALAHYHLGRAYLEIKKSDSAVLAKNEFNASLQLDPNSKVADQARRNLEALATVADAPAMSATDARVWLDCKASGVVTEGRYRERERSHRWEIQYVYVIDKTQGDAGIYNFENRSISWINRRGHGWEATIDNARVLVQQQRETDSDEYHHKYDYTWVIDRKTLEYQHYGLKQLNELKNPKEASWTSYSLNGQCQMVPPKPLGADPENKF
jgi:tetratricopeptide (TPR) repeat protein